MNQETRGNPDTVHSPSMTLWKAVLLYWAGTIVIVGTYYFLILLGVDSKAKWPLVVLFSEYLGVGVYLNRVVLRGLIEWHPIYNTVENVSSGKLKMLLLWPITYPFLFIRLGIAQHL